MPGVRHKISLEGTTVKSVDNLQELIVIFYQSIM